MLQIEGKGFIGDITEDGKGLKWASLRTHNDYAFNAANGQTVEMKNTEFWRIGLTNKAYAALNGCEKGTPISFSGFAKNNYNKEQKQQYVTLSLNEAEILPELEKKDAKIEVNGRGTVFNLEVKDSSSVHVNLSTSEKFTTKNDKGELIDQYRNMSWRTNMAGSAKLIAKDCADGQRITIEGQLHNNKGADGKLHYNITAFKAKRIERIEKKSIGADQQAQEKATMKETPKKKAAARR